MHKVAIVGASGYTGAELMRLCAAHPQLEVVAIAANSSAGQEVADVHPNLAGLYPGTEFDTYTPDVAAGTDVVFLALPHGESQRLMPDLSVHATHVVDLAGDFRFADTFVYERWYGEAHRSPERLGDFVYGLPELFREDLASASNVAVAGCYVTAASLALAPLLRSGLIEPKGIVVDAVSGVSGAGRSPSTRTSFATVDQDVTAYGLLDHRHTPEIEMAISKFGNSDAQVLFTPHLVPMTRGILATCYGRSTGGSSTADVVGCLNEAYGDEPFVQVGARSPSTKATLGSNSVQITARVDARTGWTVAIAALDNLGKGAAGQAVQCANVLLGLPETTGLPIAGLYA